MRPIIERFVRVETHALTERSYPPAARKVGVRLHVLCAMARTRQRPVTEGAKRALCRIGLVGDSKFVKRTRNILIESGIEVAWVQRPGAKALDDPQAPEHLNALVASCPSDSGGDSMVGRLCEQWPQLPIVVVVAAIGEKTARTMLRAGARGIVLEEELEQALAPALRAAQVGQIAIPRSGRRQIFRPVLSHRENTVLAMVAFGRSNTEIAVALHVEESTVKSHLGSLFAKLGVRSREEAAAVVLDGDSQANSGILAVTDQQQRPGKPNAAKRRPPRKPTSGERLAS